jgi:RHS repeat-associated protein
MTAYGSVLTAGYTGDGLRAWKQNASGRTYFLYDGTLPVAEMDSSGTMTATNTFGATGLLSRRTGSSSVFYSFDSEGNVAQRSDTSGSVLSNHLFSAHGSLLLGTSSDPFVYKAQFGYYSDNKTGLQLLTLRYYDPSAGRFLTRDPISYGGGVNLYAHVASNPVNFQDQRGTGYLKVYSKDGSVVFYIWCDDPSAHDVANDDRYIDTMGRAIQLYGDDKTNFHSWGGISMDGSVQSDQTTPAPGSYTGYLATEDVLQKSGYQEFCDIHPDHLKASQTGTNFAKPQSPTLHITIFRSAGSGINGHATANSPLTDTQIHMDPHSPINDRIRHIWYDVLP